MIGDDTETAVGVPTLGARLDAVGRRLAGRHLVTYPWAMAAQTLLARVDELSDPYDGRFDRHERRLGSGPAMPAAVPSPLVITATRPPAPPLRGEASAASPAVSIGSGAAAPAAPPTTTAGAAAPARPANVPAAPGRALPADVRARLRQLVGPAADVMRVHDGPAADALARSHHADAVTIGHDVHLRSGRLRVDEPAGFALLAHEATHVGAVVAADGGARRTRPGGVAAEEETALAIEAMAYLVADPGAPPEQPAAPAPVPREVSPLPAPAATAAAPASTSPPAARPMTAQVDRSVPGPAALDIERLRRELVGDLMRQLRSEFERGA